MTILYGEGDGIIGERIICYARRINVGRHLYPKHIDTEPTSPNLETVNATS